MADSHREEISKLEALYAGNPGGRVFVHLAEAYRKAGEHERARRILDEGLARHTDSASGYVVLGRVLADMQITDEAEIAFRRVLELDGGNLIALRWLGDIARQGGRNAEAAMHYRELLIRNPSNEEVRDLVEIVEREATEHPAPEAAAAGSEAPPQAEDAFAGLALDADADPDGTAVSPPVSPAEEAAVSPPAPVDRAPEPDITPWSAAPGHTGDAVETPVEYGVVGLDIDSAAPEAPAGPDASTTEAKAPTHEAAQEATGEDRGDSGAFHFGSEPTSASDADEDPAAAGSADESPGVFELAPDESDVVSAVGEDDVDVLELDELRRDDEAEPVEIHLLDPSYEPSGEEDEDEYVSDIDLSDLTRTPLIEEADDYADDSFIADLSSAGAEQPPEDELRGSIDVMDAALTLLPDDDAGTVDEPGQADQEAAGLVDAEAADDGLPDAGLPDAGLADAGLADADFPDVEASDAAAPAPELAGESPVEEQPADASSFDAAEGFDSDVPEMELLESDVTASEPDVEPDESSDAEFTFGMPREAAPAGADAEGLVDALSGADPAGLSGAAMPAAENTPDGAENLLPEAEKEEPSVTGAEEPGGAAEGRADAGLMTETMAVLYRSQGFHDRAADVYRALLRSRPGDERLEARLRDAEEAAGGAARRQGAEEPASEDETGEVWLRGVGAAWTTPADAAAEEATPYAWTGDADETDGGEAISSYLQDLVSWKAGSGAWIQPEPADTPDGGDIEMPDWLDGPGANDSWTPESEPPGHLAVPAAEADWSPPAADAWDAIAPETAPDAPAADEPDDAAPEEWQVPSDSMEPQLDAGTDADSDDAADTGGGWTPLELDDDIVPGAAATAAESPPPGLQPEPLPEEESSDDDDLEMFRSWLQSLKK